MLNNIRSGSYVAQMAPEVMELYGYAIQQIAAADGELAQAELDYFYDEARFRGVPEGVLHQWLGYDWQTGNLEDLLKQLAAKLSAQEARFLIYDAVRVANADGNYHQAERQAVKQAAALLLIGESELDQLEKLVATELEILTMQSQLFPLTRNN